LAKADALYLSTLDDCDRQSAIEQFDQWRKGLTSELKTEGMAIWTQHDLARLTESIHELFAVSSVSSVVNY
jgi:hypothetical protein